MASIYQSSFAGGEWSPSMYGRIDFGKYGTAAKTVKNYIVEPHGPLQNRPGTRYAGTCLGKSRVIPFQFNVEQSYFLVLSDLKIRIVKDGGFVVYPAGHASEGQIVEITSPWAEADLFSVRFTQSADTMFMVHPSHAPRILTRTDHHLWTLAPVTFGSSTSAPTITTNPGGAHSFVVTAIANGTESIPSSVATADNGEVIGWSAVTGAEFYRVYKADNGLYGWMDDVGATSYTVPDALPDMSVTAPKAVSVFASAGNYPGAVTIHQGRLVFARTDNNPQTVFGSRTGDFPNFNRSTPLRDDDAYEFALDSGQVNEIRAMVAMQELILLTSGSEFKLSGGSSSDAITPTSYNASRQGHVGAAGIEPIAIGNAILYVQFGGAAVRDLSYTLDVDGYRGDELTIMARHLFKNRKIVDWAYQRSPYSVVWCILDDGSLVGLTYMKEQDVFGWHRHETQGFFESVASVSDGDNTDEVAFIVRRVIDGVEVRFVEQLGVRFLGGDERPEMAYFVDAGLTYDNPIDIDGITGASISSTAHGLVDGNLVRISKIVTVSGDNHELNDNWYMVDNATADAFDMLDKYGGAAIDATGFEVYLSGGEIRKGVTTISGLDHLEGMSVSVLADGHVYFGLSVSSGSISFYDPVATVHVGLGFESELETLDAVIQTESGPVQDRTRRVRSIIARVENTRALLAGSSSSALDEAPIRSDENYDDPIAMFTGDIEIGVSPGDGKSARVVVKNTYPVPQTIVALITRLEVGE